MRPRGWIGSPSLAVRVVPPMPFAKSLKSRAVPRSVFAGMLVAIALAGFPLTLAPVRAAGELAATPLREFSGGVRADAKLADPSIIFRISNACYAQFPFARHQSSAPAERCIIDKLRSAGASMQAIAFARFAPVPAALARVYRYRVAAAVYADMRWADGAGGWCLIGRAGDAVPMWGPIDLSRDPRFAAFAKTHPGAVAWMPDGPGEAPRVKALPRGGQRFIFKFALKSCRACALDGMAAIGFDFDAAGKFTGSELDALGQAPAAR